MFGITHWQSIQQGQMYVRGGVLIYGVQLVCLYEHLSPARLAQRLHQRLAVGLAHLADADLFQALVPTPFLPQQVVVKVLAIAVPVLCRQLGVE